jgi:L-lactate dehydrogenase
VDILSYVAWKISGLHAGRVIGSGTILDSARFRYLLSQHTGVDPRSIHAYIIGEHGDSEVPVWSLANIAGMQLKRYCEANCKDGSPAIFDEIYQQTRDAAYQIIQRKGATYYAVANGILRIVEAILRDQKTVLSLSTLVNDFYGIDDVYLSLPCVVNISGIERFLRLELDPKEIEGLQASARVLKDLIEKLEL